MNVEKKSLPKSEVELKIELTDEELKPYLEKAAANISKNKEIPGFRPGKAPYNKVVDAVGEMAVYQEAVYQVIDKILYQILIDQDVNAVGQPKIDVEKLAPGNPFVFRATVAIFPEVELGDFSKIKIKKEKIEIDKEEVNKTIDGIKKMRAKEVLVEKVAAKGDKVEINFDVKLDNVVIENGSAKKYPMVIGDGHMLEDFEKNLIGMKAGEEKTFKLKFPKDYSSKNLANRETEIDVKVNAVYELTLPEINEEFLKTLGSFKTEDDFRKQIEDNIKHEQEHKESHRVEIELYDKLVETCKFEEIPEILLNNEIEKMVMELQDSLTQKGMKLEDYLGQIGKKQSDLKVDFAPDAHKRVKIAVMNKQIAKIEKIEISDEELNKEIEKLKELYGKNEDFMKSVDDPRYQHYVKNSLVNQKVVKYLKDKYIQ